MNPFLDFVTRTRLWIIPLGIMWLVLMAAQNELGFARFRTVDAGFYQELAQDFLSGKPMVLDGLNNQQGNAFSPYPPGYPVLLGISSFVSGSGHWLNHVFLHAILLLILVLVWQNHASLLPLGLVVFSDSALNLSSLGISEFPFLIFSILSVFCLSRLEQRSDWLWQIGLTLCLCLSFWIRYAGVFFLPVLLLRYLEIRDISMHKARQLAWVMIYFVLFICILCGSQWLETGLITGGDRYANSDNSLKLIFDLSVELINQVSLFRDFRNSSWISFLAGFVFLILLIFLIVKVPLQSDGSGFQAKDEFHAPFMKLLSRNLFLAGIVYVLFMVVIRWYFYFAESFDLRLLGPGACLIWLGWAVKMDANIGRQPLIFKLGFLLLVLVFYLPSAFWPALMNQ